MDARATLLIGGGAAVAVTVAVASVIGITSAVALADRPGTPMADASIVVPGQTAATPAPAATASKPVTVPAPAAQEITSPSARKPAVGRVDPGTGSADVGSSSSRSADRSVTQVVPSEHTGKGETLTDRTNAAKVKSEVAKAAAAKAAAAKAAAAKAAKTRAERGSDKGRNGKNGDATSAIRREWTWDSDLVLRLQQLHRQIEDSADKAGATSGQVHPRTWIGRQEQSSRSPDRDD
ncbi:hypothetical protein [Microbacterium sp.]|uniref:hypothetical protein n=1 Tax=Microbacterium sp. TaxID=51671 RepID=UPI003A8FA5DD